MSNESVAWIFVIVILLLLILDGGRRRSRYIKKRDQRIADAKHVLDFYEKPENRNKAYRRKDYERDHFVPFAKGGSNEAHNLRLIPKKENRRKGAKMPSLWNRFWNS